MKVILIADVKTLGKKDEMVEVSDGYGRNYLLPRGLAVEATAANINKMKDKQKAAESKQAREQAQAEAFRDKLTGKTVIIKVKAGENGKLFGAVAAKDIADAVKAQLGIDIDKKKIVLEEPIKAVGAYNVPLKLYPGISAKLDINVKAD